MARKEGRDGPSSEKGSVARCKAETDWIKRSENILQGRAKSINFYMGKCYKMWKGIVNNRNLRGRCQLTASLPHAFPPLCTGINVNIIWCVFLVGKIEDVRCLPWNSRWRSCWSRRRSEWWRPCGVKVLSWSHVDLESKRVSWRYGKRNKLEEQVYDLKKEE